MKKLREWAGRLKSELFVLGIALRHPQTPWYAKGFIIIIIGYAVSPIDLIPDFIPVIGLLDDLILLPLGIYFTLKLIPKKVVTEARGQASMATHKSTRMAFTATIIIISIWILVLSLVAWKIFNRA